MAGVFPIVPFPPVDSGWVGGDISTDALFGFLPTYMGMVYDEQRPLVTRPLDADEATVLSLWPDSSARGVPSLDEQRFTAVGFDNGENIHIWAATPAAYQPQDCIAVDSGKVGFEIEFSLPLNPVDTGRIELRSSIEFWTGGFSDLLASVELVQKAGVPNENEMTLAVEYQPERIETLLQEHNILGVLFDGDNGVARFWLNGTEITPTDNGYTLTEFFPSIKLHQNGTLAVGMQGERMGIRFITDPFFITTPFPAGTVAVDRVTPIAKTPSENYGDDSLAILLSAADYAEEIIRLVDAPSDLINYAGGVMESSLATAVTNNGCLSQLNDPESTVQGLPVPVSFAAGEYTTVLPAEKLYALDSERRFRQDLVSPASTVAYAASKSAPLAVPESGLVFSLGITARNVIDDTGIITAGVALAGADGIIADCAFTITGNSNMAVDARATGVESPVSLEDSALPGASIIANLVTVHVKQDAIDVYGISGGLLGTVAATIESVYPVAYILDRDDSVAGRQVDLTLTNVTDSFLTNTVPGALHLCQADPAGEPGIDVDERDMGIVNSVVGTFSARMGKNVRLGPVEAIDNLLTLGYAIGLAATLDARTGNTDGMDAVVAAFTANENDAFSYSAMSRYGCMMKSLYPEATNFFHSMLRVVYEEIDPGNLPEWLEEANFGVLCKYLNRSLVEKRLWYLVGIR